MGSVFHVLMKTPPLAVPHARMLREIKEIAKRHKVPSLVSKTVGGSSGLVYIESRDKMAVHCFEEDIRSMTNSKQRFVTIVPTMKAPIPEDQLDRSPGKRFVVVGDLASFGFEMARRVLWDWWADIVRRGYFKDQGDNPDIGGIHRI